MAKEKQEKQVVEVPDFITVRDLAKLIEVSPIEVMRKLIANGIMASINQQIDFETAAIVMNDFGIEAKSTTEVEVPEVTLDDLPEWRRVLAGEDRKSLTRRPPVVTILGHVDHGKTSLLDAIRSAHVADGEAGGITQHIGAYQVVHNDQKITFLDTPGHEAFTAMRARGAQGADVVVLVVAADDGVMQTTREAINHARAAHVPIVVAMNKIDKRNANPDKVKQELAEIGLNPDDWGGDTMVIPVSARDRTGIADLLEAVSLTAESVDIAANPKAKSASGTVIESRMEKNRGVLATLLVQNGTLRVGDVVVVGTSVGKLRAMFDEKGQSIKEAPPSTPAQVMGLDTLPSAGDTFITYRTEKEARILVEERRNAQAASVVRADRPAMSMEEFFKNVAAGIAKDLLLIVKVDVQGSLEPVLRELNAVGDQSKSESGVGLRVLHSDVGRISENDVNLAASSKAVVIGFTVEADKPARALAEAHNVDVRQYDNLYQLREDVEKALKGMLDPVYEDKVIGKAEVRKVFKISKIGNIAGCIIRDGEARRNAKARVLRGRQTLIQSTTVASLKREIEDAREVRAGLECGIRLDNFNEFIPGDMIEFFVTERVN